MSIDGTWHWDRACRGLCPELACGDRTHRSLPRDRAAETNKKFAEHVEADYPILSDPEKNVATAYGVVDAQRQFAARWTFYIGPDGRILDVDAKVSPRTAGEDVVTKLEGLKIPKSTATRPK